MAFYWWASPPLGERPCRFCHENIYITAKKNMALRVMGVTGLAVVSCKPKNKDIVEPSCLSLPPPIHVAPMSPIRYSRRSLYSHSPLDVLASRYVLAATMAPMCFGAGPTRVKHWFVLPALVICLLLPVRS